MSKLLFKFIFRLKILAIILISFYACSSPERPDIVFDDFEHGTYKHWNIQGSSFITPISKDSLKPKIENGHGKFAAASFLDNDTANWYPGKNQGKLISKPFIIDRNFIQFLIGGGQHETRECINLMVNNKVVKFATGKNNNTLSSVLWDVSTLQGKEAVIEIVDALFDTYQDDSLGYVIVDHIVFTDNIHEKELVFENFESGTYNNWTVDGDAFEMPRNRTNVYYPISANGFNGNYFAFSFGDTHDVKQGKLTSASFTVNHDYVKFLVGGGGHKGRTCINFVVNDSTVFSAEGMNDGQMRSKQWDVRAFKGEMARIEIVDDYSEGWGHIMVDDIIFYDETPFFKFSILLGIVLLGLLTFFVVLRKINFKREEKTKQKVDKEILEKLEALKLNIANTECYKNSSITIKEISTQTGFKIHEINELFETVDKTSFVHYLNTLRVKAFKKELKDPLNKAYTMISIAEKCGFSSKTSFYRVFKSITNMTPSEYKKSI